MSTLAQGERQSNRSCAAPDSFEPVTVAEWPINKRDIVRATLEYYKGYWLFNFRKWYETADGERRPAKQGIAFRVEHLPRVANTVGQALALASEKGLLSTDEAVKGSGEFHVKPYVEDGA
jgi:Transcriptional Coactivator p15 (PC4)